MTEAVCNVVDLSNFTGDITPATAACWQQLGVLGAIVGCQDTTVAVQQAKTLLAAGFTVELYAFMYWGLSTVGQVQAAMQVASASGLAGCLIWLDCEAYDGQNEATGTTPALRCSQLSDAVAYVIAHGYKAGIYTGAWYWPTYMDNTTLFSGLPLWHAGYPADHSLISSVSYGGWTQVSMHQFEGSVSLCGATIDEDDDITGICSHTAQPQPAPQPQEGDDTDNELRQVMLRGLIDPQTNQPVNVQDAAALQRVLDNENMGGLGVANAVQGAQLGVAMLQQGKTVPPHTHVAGAVATPAGVADHESMGRITGPGVREAEDLYRRVQNPPPMYPYSSGVAAGANVYPTPAQTRVGKYPHLPIEEMLAQLRTPADMKLGKLPYRHDRRTLALARYIGMPFASPSEWSVADAVSSYPMYGNDEYGDCTLAAAAHMVEIWEARDGHGTKPATNTVIGDYLAITGGKDEGAVELDVLRWWKTNGIDGHRPYGFALVNAHNRSDVCAAASLFSGLYIGIQLPITAQQQTGPGKTWDVPVSSMGPNMMPGSWGGHAVNVVGYDEKGVTVVTWGALQRMTWAFWRRYVDEVWAVLPAEWRDYPPKIKDFDFNTLAADLRRVGQEES